MLTLDSDVSDYRCAREVLLDYACKTAFYVKYT